jgi:hypothetical protein
MKLTDKIEISGLDRIVIKGGDKKNPRTDIWHSVACTHFILSNFTLSMDGSKTKTRAQMARYLRQKLAKPTARFWISCQAPVTLNIAFDRQPVTRMVKVILPQRRRYG